MGNRISDDALSLIAEFDVETPKRFLDIWNVISPRLARKLWRCKFIKEWNLQVPFPNMYQYFADRLGCQTCAYLMYCPKPGVCGTCDCNGGPYEKKTHLQSRYSLRPMDFHLLPPIPVTIVPPSRGQFFCIKAAFWHAFKRRSCDWRTWYQDLRRQDGINAKKNQKREARKAQKAAEKHYVDLCNRAREMVTWSLIKTMIRKPVQDVRIAVQEVVTLIHYLGLDDRVVMSQIKSLPLDDVALWRILNDCCLQKFILEYCPYAAAISTLQNSMEAAGAESVPYTQVDVNDLALKASALGFAPYDYPWRLNITPLDWMMRESQLQAGWTNQQKTCFMMKPAVEQIQPMELAWTPSAAPVGV